MSITTAVNEFAAELAAEFPQWRVVRDPAKLVPPCLFLGVPTVESRSLGGFNIELPVSLVAPAPGSLTNITWLTDHIEEILDACGTGEATPTVVRYSDDVEFPAYTLAVMLGDCNG